MKVIVRPINNEIIAIKSYAMPVSNGVAVPGYIIGEDDLVIYDVLYIPPEVSSNKYCYSTTEGFYENQDYVGPSDYIELQQLKDELEAQKAINEDLLLMMADIIASL